MAIDRAVVVLYTPTGYCCCALCFSVPLSLNNVPCLDWTLLVVQCKFEEVYLVTQLIRLGGSEKERKQDFSGD